MTRMGVYDQIKRAFQDVVAPEINELRGEIRRLDQKIDGVNAALTARIDAVDRGLTAKIDGLTAKIDGVDTGLTAKIDGVDTKVNSLRTEMLSMKAELLAEIRRVDNRIDGLDRQLQIAIDIRERLAALEARRPS